MVESMDERNERMLKESDQQMLTRLVTMANQGRNAYGQAMSPEERLAALQAVEDYKRQRRQDGERDRALGQNDSRLVIEKQRVDDQHSEAMVRIRAEQEIEEGRLQVARAELVVRAIEAVANSKNPEQLMPMLQGFTGHLLGDNAAEAVKLAVSEPVAVIEEKAESAWMPPKKNL